MKKYVLLSLVSAGSLFLATPVVLAQTAQVPATQTASAATSWVDMSTVVQNLEGAGYTTIEQIKRRGDAYKAEVWDKTGKEYKVSLDSKTGKITETRIAKEASKSSLKPQAVSALSALGKVKAAGYHDVYELETESSFYEVEAFNKQGKKVKLVVDGTTGAITPAKKN